MPRSRQTNNLYHCRHKQHGAALMVMLVIMVMGSAAFLVSSLSKPGLKIERDKKISSDALLQTAKEALISYAVSRGDIAGTPRPGDLPCPDRKAPGDSGYGDAEGSCSAGGGTSIGRLPWKTLGIPKLVDAAGEPLWYALSDNFRATNDNPPPINSDTQGTLSVYDADGTTLLTPSGSKAVAIIFSTGAIVGSQRRGTTTEKKDPSNYLETGPNSRNNANAAGPFIAANESDTFNDHLLYITADQLLPSVEKRAGNELRNLLKTYYSSWGAYPFAALFDSPLTASFTGSATNYNGLPPYGDLNGIPGTQPPLPVWNAIPTITFTGGSPSIPMSCILTNGAAANSRWRCCDTGGGASCTGNNITIPAGVTVTITGRLNNVGLGFWKMYDITDTTPQVRARNSSGTTVKASSLLDNVSVTSTQSYTDGSATVVFSGTGKSGGTVLQRIELRDIQYQSSPLPSWFQVNNWHQLMYYATSTNYAFGGNKSCTPACLTVNGSGGVNTNKPAAVVMTGKVLTGQSRSSSPLALCPATGTTIAPNQCPSNYLELENATPADFIYENKTRSSTFNDQVIIVAP